MSMTEQPEKEGGGEEGEGRGWNRVDY